MVATVLSRIDQHLCVTRFWATSYSSCMLWAELTKKEIGRVGSTSRISTAVIPLGAAGYLVLNVFKRRLCQPEPLGFLSGQTPTTKRQASPIHPLSSYMLRL